MNVSLRDLLDLPEARELAATVEAEEFRQSFSQRMADLNRHFQVMAGQASRADYEPLEDQKMKLYEAFQKSLALLDSGNSAKVEQSISRVMTALKAVEERAAEKVVGVANGREEWSKRADGFDDMFDRIGELEDAGNSKAPVLRKLADGIRGRANQRCYDQSTAAYDQLRPKLDQIYQQHQQETASTDGDMSLGGVFPEILWEQNQADFQQADSMVRELEDAELPKAPLLRKAMDTIKSLADQNKLKEALAGYQKVRPQIDAEYERLNRIRAGGVRMSDDASGESSIPMGGPGPSMREPQLMQQTGKGESVNGDSFVDHPHYSATEEPNNPPPHQDATKTPRGDRKTPGAGTDAQRGSGYGSPKTPGANGSPKTPGAYANGSPTVLKMGSKGPEVQKLQSLLGIAADGDFGKGTQSAVIAFQKSKGLTADGVVGGQTWAALGGAPKTPAQPNGKGSQVPREHEPHQMEQPGKQSPPAQDNYTDSPNYQYTETEVRGTADEPLAADYYPEGLPYTEGDTTPHQDATRTPRGDRKTPGAGTDAQPTTSWCPPAYGSPKTHEPRVIDESGGMPNGERINMPGMDEGDTTMSYAGAAHAEQTPDGEVKMMAGSVETSPNGVSASGVMFQETDGGMTTTVGKGEFKSGSFQEEDGEQRLGMKVSVVGAKKEFDAQKEFGLNEGLVLKGDFGTGTASAENSVGEKGWAGGAQANAGEASVTVGSNGTGDRDGTTRFGVSEGVGLAGRLHWDDADKDGIPEYGVGADFEWVSFDVKTEDPLRTASQWMNPTGGMTTPFMPEGNMTQDAMKGAEGAGVVVGQAINWAKEQGSQFQDGGVTMGGGSGEEFSQSASDSRDRQNERDAEMGQQVVQGVEDFSDRLFGDS